MRNASGRQLCIGLATVLDSARAERRGRDELPTLHSAPDRAEPSAVEYPVCERDFPEALLEKAPHRLRDS